MAPKLSGVGDDATAHQLQPDAIGHHAGGERVVLRRDPKGEVESPAACGICSRARLGAKHLDEPARHDVAGLFEVATDEDGLLIGITAVEHAHRQSFRCHRHKEIEIGLHAVARSAVKPLRTRRGSSSFFCHGLCLDASWRTSSRMRLFQRSVLFIKRCLSWRYLPGRELSDRRRPVGFTVDLDERAGLAFWSWL